MSVYNKPDLNINFEFNTPSYSYSHKRIYSQNFEPNSGRLIEENSKKYFNKNKLKIKNTNLNTQNNISKCNNFIKPNPSINKVLTTSNLNKRWIETDLNRNNSPNSKFNKSNEEKILFIKNKQSTSQNNINKNIINYNLKNINNKKRKNSLNNINININISKKFISNYYNKSKDKKNLIVKKKSINSSINSNNKEQNQKNNKYYKINNNTKNNKNELKRCNLENIIKNQSESFLIKKRINDSCIINFNSNQAKKRPNQNSLVCFSSNSNISINNNKNNNFNNNSNAYMNINMNLTNGDINNNYYSNRNNKKNYGNFFNKIIKENKSTFFPQIQVPVRAPLSPGNVNSIQNYLKYLNTGQKYKNKNHKNSPHINKNRTHKLSANNLNYSHNNTESNLFNNIYYSNNSTYNYDVQNTFSQNIYNYNNFKKNDIIFKLKSNQKHNSINFSEYKGNKDFSFDTPEEFHFFYVKLLVKGKKVKFDDKNK